MIKVKSVQSLLLESHLAIVLASLVPEVHLLYKCLSIDILLLLQVLVFMNFSYPRSLCFPQLLL
jgi:hypothetical protein